MLSGFWPLKGWIHLTAPTLSPLRPLQPFIGQNPLNVKKFFADVPYVKSLKKKKREDVKNKKLIAAPCKAISKLLLKNMCVIRKCIPAFCGWSMIMMKVAMYLPSTNKLV